MRPFVRRAPCLASRVSFQRLSRLCCIGFLICSYLGAVAWGQPPAASVDPFAGLRSGSLTVWESGRASFLGWHTIQRELSSDFPQLQVTFRLLAAKDFIPTQHETASPLNIRQKTDFSTPRPGKNIEPTVYLAYRS